MQERDRGERIPSARSGDVNALLVRLAKTLSSYLFQVHDEARQVYIEFHLQTIACPLHCTASLADLRTSEGNRKPGERAAEAILCIERGIFAGSRAM